ncbi:Bax inhibitor-1 family protein [Alistipes sp.]|uniref:Bax inhibitor-1/YccA family protein n=1 Tax=Alistipes sp. TaxID=1872444 RepID=UPI003A8492B1
METTNSTLTAARTDAARTALFRNVYLWMTMALALTALTAYTVAGSETLLQAIFTNRALFFGLIIGELALVFILAANILRMSFLTATLMFIAYSVVNGATLSVIFLVYDLGSIGLTFLVTAGMFGAMSLYGFVTGRDLSSWGNLLFMALVGVVIASLVNLFLKSETLMWIVTYIGIVLFVGLTAYDTQRIKRMIHSGAAVDETMQKLALLGALSLYLDFVNLFLYMLRLLGNRR